jgi:hypothetical protein
MTISIDADDYLFEALFADLDWSWPGASAMTLPGRDDPVARGRAYDRHLHRCLEAWADLRALAQWLTERRWDVRWSMDFDEHTWYLSATPPVEFELTAGSIRDALTADGIAQHDLLKVTLA